MLNQFVIVGKVDDFYDKEHFLVKIPRKDNEYDIVKIKVTMEDIMNNLEIDMMVGVRGMFRGIYPNIELVAEKVSYLSDKKGTKNNG